MFIVLNVLIIFVFLIPLYLAIFFWYKRNKILRKIKSQKNLYMPYVSAIMPFKGEDYNFRNTVKSLLNQKYSGEYEVLFVTSDNEGMSIDIIKELTHGKSNAFLIYAKKDNMSVNRGDKVNNLLNGIKNVNIKSQVFLFIDSDMVPHEKWIENMVQPLQFSDCGISSGSAWVVSKRGGLWELSTRFWDFLATTMVTFPLTSFARGLSMGMRRSEFVRLKIEQIWSGAFHDNFTLSNAIRKANLRIYYAPLCIIEEHFNLNGFEWVSWVKRQAVHTKTHYKKLWVFGFFAVTLPRFLGAILFLGTMLISLVYSDVFNLFIAFTVWPLLHFINAFAIVFTVSQDAKLINNYRNKFIEKLIVVLASYVTIIHCLGSIWAILSNKIEWRKITYREKSAYKTVIEGEVNDV